jgi:hypothetical protein
MTENYEKDFVPYEQALALKELGFDEPCLAHLIGFGDGTIENGLYKINQQQVFYPNDYTSSDDKAEELGLHPFGMCGVPLYQQAFRWFREKYGYYYPIHRTTNNTNQVLYSIGPYAGDYFTYEEAELACLVALIKIVKKQNSE